MNLLSMSSNEKPFEDVYDNEDDIYYVSFKTNEPSYVEEVDEIFMLEIGMFSGMITGFRVLGYSKHKDKIEFGVVKKEMVKRIESTKKCFPTVIKDRETIMKQALTEVFR
jgi:hypothetical protein